MTLPETCLCGQSVCPRCFPGLAESHPYAQLRARMSPAAQAQAAAQAHALLAAMPDEAGRKGIGRKGRGGNSGSDPFLPHSLLPSPPDETPVFPPGRWFLWCSPSDDRPYLHPQIDIWRCAWAMPCRVNPWSLPPQMNVVDLYWRPVQEEEGSKGIGRKEQGGTPNPSPPHSITPSLPSHSPAPSLPHSLLPSPSLTPSLPAAFPSALPGGWSLWAYPVADDSPYLHRHVEIWRQESATPRVVSPWSLPAQLNVVDLYWRPLRDDDEESP